jgi:hypothetical protein
MIESWRPVLGYEDRYEVSDFGRVRSLDAKDRLGRNRKGTMRSLWKKPCGHLQVNLYRDGKRQHRLVHHLVLEAFVGPRPPGKETRHLNGKPDDNRRTNLCWGSRGENHLDRIRHGVIVIGTPNPAVAEEKNPRAKLSRAQAVMAYRLRAQGKLQREIAAKLGVTQPNISYLLRGKSWPQLHMEMV